MVGLFCAVIVRGKVPNINNNQLVSTPSTSAW